MDPWWPQDGVCGAQGAGAPVLLEEECAARRAQAQPRTGANREQDARHLRAGHAMLRREPFNLLAERRRYLQGERHRDIPPRWSPAYILLSHLAPRLPALWGLDG